MFADPGPVISLLAKKIQPPFKPSVVRGVLMNLYWRHYWSIASRNPFSTLRTSTLILPMRKQRTRLSLILLCRRRCKTNSGGSRTIRRMNTWAKVSAILPCDRKGKHGIVNPCSGAGPLFRSSCRQFRCDAIWSLSLWAFYIYSNLYMDFCCYPYVCTYKNHALADVISLLKITKESRFGFCIELSTRAQQRNPRNWLWCTRLSHRYFCTKKFKGPKFPLFLKKSRGVWEKVGDMT